MQSKQKKNIQTNYKITIHNIKKKRVYLKFYSLAVNIAGDGGAALRLD